MTDAYVPFTGPPTWQHAACRGEDPELPLERASDGTLGYRAPAVIALTGLTYRQLDYWVRVGYLHPHNNALGSGTARIWPPPEVAVAATMARLVHAGLDVGIAADAARQLHQRRNRVTAGIAPGVTVTVRPVTP